eukprot:12900784-Prorocentrum_lima.AAC.1
MKFLHLNNNKLGGAQVPPQTQASGGTPMSPPGQPDAAVGGLPPGAPLAQATHVLLMSAGINQVLAPRVETPTLGQASTMTRRMQWD